jgi:hypothetical protein
VVLPPLAIAVAAGGKGVSISLGENALALLLLPLVVVALLWLARNKRAHAGPGEPPLAEQHERPEGLVAPTRIRRRALGWAFVFPVLFFYAWGSGEQRLARATPVLTDAVAAVWPEEIRVRRDGDAACRPHALLADEFDDLSPRYCVLGADSQAVLVVAKVVRSETAARRFRLSAVERRYGGATEGAAVVLFPLPPRERAREAATAAARAAATLDEFG